MDFVSPFRWIYSGFDDLDNHHVINLEIKWKRNKALNFCCKSWRKCYRLEFDFRSNFGFISHFRKFQNFILTKSFKIFLKNPKFWQKFQFFFKNLKILLKSSKSIQNLIKNSEIYKIFLKIPKFYRNFRQNSTKFPTKVKNEVKNPIFWSSILADAYP